MDENSNRAPRSGEAWLCLFVRDASPDLPASLPRPKRARQLDLFALPEEATPSRDAPPDWGGRLCWFSSTGHLVGAAHLSTQPSERRLLESLETAMAAPWSGLPRVPDIVTVTDDRAAATFRSVSARYGFRVAMANAGVDDLGLAAEALEPPHPSSLERSVRVHSPFRHLGIDPSLARGFFHAMSAVFASDPWPASRRAAALPPLRVDIPAFDVDGAVLVVPRDHASASSLELFPCGVPLDRIRSALRSRSRPSPALDDPRPPVPPSLSVVFSIHRVFSIAQRAEREQCVGRTSGNEPYPQIYARLPQARLRFPTARDLAVLEVLGQGLAAFVTELRTRAYIRDEHALRLDPPLRDDHEEGDGPNDGVRWSQRVSTHAGAVQVNLSPLAVLPQRPL